MDYRTIHTVDEMRRYLEGARIVAFDFKTAPLLQYREEPKAALDAHKALVVGVSMSVREGSAIYAPLNHCEGGNVTDAAEVWAFLRSALFTNTGVVKVAHNLSFESMFLYALGIVLQPPCYDTIAAAQMTLKAPMEFRGLGDSGLKLLSTSLLGAHMPSYDAVTDGRHFATSSTRRTPKPSAMRAPTPTIRSGCTTCSTAGSRRTCPVIVRSWSGSRAPRPFMSAS